MASLGAVCTISGSGLCYLRRGCSCTHATEKLEVPFGVADGQTVDRRQRKG